MCITPSAFPDMAPLNVQSEVHYQGHVQGVGFRYSTQAIAARYNVNGYVKNLPDGRVQLVVEGSAEELDRFLQDVSERLSRYITGVQREIRPATDTFSHFEIAF